MRRSTPVSLLEVFPDDEHHGPRSNEWLRRAFHQRTILISNPVYAELAPAFDSREALDEALREISASISPIDTEIACEAAFGRDRTGNLILAYMNPLAASNTKAMVAD